MNRRLLHAFLIAQVASLMFVRAGHAQDVRESVVKIFTSKSPPNPFRPWEITTPTDVTGSGVVIEGGRILTSAHVVAYAQQIYVQTYQSSDKLDATVEFIAQDCDLATLVLDEPGAGSHLAPVPLADDLPPLKAKISVLGYPTGGESLSVTEGVVSRIEYASYVFGTAALRIQVDAAINPGNSGGPGIVDDHITGVVFSRFREGESIGYLIPAEVVRHFLDDFGADGRYDGFPKIDAVGATLENPTLREYLKLADDQTGVVIHRVNRAEIADLLRPWDVVTACDGTGIDNGGKVLIAEGIRVSWGYLISRRPPGSSVKLDIVREGKALRVEVPTITCRNTLIQRMTSDSPTYFIYGGIVFSPVTAEMLASIPANIFAALGASGRLLSKRIDAYREQPDEEIVVSVHPPPTTILPHKITKGYDLGFLTVLTHVNDQPVRNLRHMVELIKANTEPFIVLRFENEGEEKIVLDPKLVEEFTPQILRNNNIPAVCSADLRDLWP